MVLKIPQLLGVAAWFMLNIVMESSNYGIWWSENGGGRVFEKQLKIRLRHPSVLSCQEWSHRKSLYARLFEAMEDHAFPHKFQQEFQQNEEGKRMPFGNHTAYWKSSHLARLSSQHFNLHCYFKDFQLAMFEYRINSWSYPWDPVISHSYPLHPIHAYFCHTH